MSLPQLPFEGVSPTSNPLNLTSPNAQLDGFFGVSVATSGTTVAVGAWGERASGYGGAGLVYVFQASTGVLISTLTSPNAQTNGEFGYSLAISGSTVVVGAPGETASGSASAGHVYVFQVTSTTGTLLATLTSPNALFGGYFGVSVAISGTTVVVGASGETASGYLSAGHAYVFRDTAPTGTLLSTFTSPNALASGELGSSVAITGTTVVVGAPYETASGYGSAGHAYVFKDTTSTGLLLATLSSPNAQASGYLGWSVTISGTTVVVGARGETAAGYIGGGHAYVFKDTAPTGTLLAALTSPSAQASGDFGYSATISGTTVVVGAPYETASGYGSAGHAYVFKDTTPTGTLLATLTSPNAQASGTFGYSATISGSTIGIGAPEETESGSVNAGHAYVFGPVAGAQLLKLISPSAQTVGYFGWSVAISGTTVVVAASSETALGHSDAGRVYVFQTTTGALISTLTSPNAQAYGEFGDAVAISGSTVVVGAPFETASGHSNAGHTYVFRDTTPTGTLLATLTSPNAQTNGDFGTSVAISGTTVAVGAPTEPASGSADAGRLYVFKDTTPTGTLLSSLTSPNAQAGGYFGDSVAITGSTAVVGAPGETASVYVQAGHAYVLQATTGTLISTLTSPNAQASGYFGISVAISGTTVVVGALYETASGYGGAGHAYVFQDTTSTGTLLATLTSPNAQASGYFADSVAVSGSTVVVGAPQEGVSGIGGAGHAFLFKDTAPTGTLLATLTSPNAQDSGYYGLAVAISGTTVVVGAPGEWVNGYFAAGDVYALGPAAGALFHMLTSPSAQTNGYFGYSVAISGSTLVVGAWEEMAPGYSGAGQVYVFQTTTGALISTLTSPNAQTNGEFGYSVAISGSTVVVGAPNEAASGYPLAGNAYVFKDTTPTGTLLSTLTSPNAQTYGYFGSVVAISGSTAVVGAAGETASGYGYAGHAYLFQARTGTLIATLTSPNAQASGYFGTSVAISGTTVVVGAPWENASGYSVAGHAYVFQETTTTVAPMATLTSPNAQASGYFGYSVAVTGTTVAVGAPWENASGASYAGHAYVFQTTAPTNTLLPMLTSPNAQTYGFFGTSVAISGTTVVIGAGNENASGYSDAGHAYVFGLTTGAPIYTVTSPNAQTGAGFGTSVAISGTTFVVGAPYETAFGYGGAGHAYVL